MVFARPIRVGLRSHWQGTSAYTEMFLDGIVTAGVRAVDHFIGLCETRQCAGVGSRSRARIAVCGSMTHLARPDIQTPPDGEHVRQ